ncbi:hypothetical protein [uncultured Roseibium sp.]|uniref:hypothetical protein n=1 Tax=uncultured Roseibium sp. TaxID=1936171 RepID=UPI00260F1C7B|nr:hypothetical protein [uncultured Roseibium sp.]
MPTFVKALASCVLLLLLGSHGLAKDLLTSTEAEERVVTSYLEGEVIDLRVRRELTIERPYGWVVYVAPARFLETGDEKDLVPGIGPLYVLKNGTITPLPTYLPPDASIELFEKSLK